MRISGWWCRYIGWRFMPKYQAYLELNAWVNAGRRGAWDEQGRCPGCGACRDDGHKWCGACRRSRAKTQKAIYDDRVANGLCVKCKAPVDRDGVMCCACVDHMAGRQAKAADMAPAA